MNRTTILLLAVASAGAGRLLAQSNERGTGYNAALTNVYDAYDWGRNGTYPNGQVGVSFANQLCNPGTIPVNWFPPNTLLEEDHPKFGFLVARDLDGRLVQISDWSYCKHAFYALSSPSVCGGTCQGNSDGRHLGVNCSDIYSNGNNGSRSYLGPPQEINPWLGTWQALGSYFDIGQPNQAGYPAPADGQKSLSTTGFDAVKNRVTLPEALIPQGVDMYFQIFVICEGERVENRANNIGTNTFRMTVVNPTQTGTGAWSTTTTGSMQQSSILHRWAGATFGMGSNGGGTYNTTFDGRFEVAVKVSGPVNGFWHYEYAVLNIDNAGGGATFGLPVCPTARVQNIGFRDIDANPLNDWTSSVSGGEILWTAPAGNSHRWNQLFNFWFDSDAAPVAGNATIDQATLQPGAALSMTVPTSVPGLQPAVYLGAGCGTPSLEFAVNGLPTIGNAGFGLQAQTGPGTPFLTVFSGPTTPVTLIPGCDVFINIASYGDLGLAFADGAGAAFVPIPVNPLWTPFDMTFQAATFVPAPPLFALFGLSNGLTVRFGGTGCQ